ncbi:MFS transporter [Zestomonas carbonaria]|uniref:Major facilitator superfamily (MFS) profile domain-containing protein n=1 Tax=Zestomonas carbonaria TaxID=2762745 RepID=A0A7U7ENT6_9GAMM|nr:MFS transporter [Pseudomonas carbonaria]CAD5108413.1 hypothetical protein PSEWESI4_02698 [Pseudomonas carbonaria]
MIAQRNWRTILLVVGAGIVSAFQVGKAPAALGIVQADLALDLATAAWMLSAFGIVGALGGIVTGVIVDHLGARRLAVGGLVLQGLACGLGAMAPDAAWLLASRAVEGLGFLAVVVAAPALIDATATPNQAPRAFAAWSTFMPVGITLVLLGAPLLEAMGWRGFWLLNAAILLGYAVLLERGTRAIARARETRSRLVGDIVETLGSPGPWLLAGLFAAFTAVYFAVFGFLPTVLEERWSLAPATASLLTAIAVLVNAGGNLAGGALLARGHSAARILQVAFAALAVCGLGIFIEAAPALLAYGLCVAFSCIGGLIPTVLFNLAPRETPRPELLGATTGWLMQGNNLGLTLGPVAAGWLAAQWGWPAISLLVAALSVAGCLLALGLGRRATSASTPGMAAGSSTGTSRTATNGKS